MVAACRCDGEVTVTVMVGSYEQEVPLCEPGEAVGHRMPFSANVRAVMLRAVKDKLPDPTVRTCPSVEHPPLVLRR